MKKILITLFVSLLLAVLSLAQERPGAVTGSAANVSALVGASGDQSMNTGRTPAQWARFQGGGVFRVLLFADGQLDTAGLTAGMGNRLSQFLPRAGSIVGYSTYLYSSGTGGTFVQSAHNNTNWVNTYLIMTNGGACTNLSTMNGNGILCDQLLIGYWASNGLGTLTVNTQSFASGTYGTKVAVQNFNMNIGSAGGPPTFVWTNVAKARDSVMAGLSYVGAVPATVIPIVGQIDTATNGYVLDTVTLEQFDWRFMNTNGGNSNVMHKILNNFDMAVIQDLGSPDQGANLFEQYRSGHTNRLDAVYLMSAVKTNDLTLAPAELNRFRSIGRQTGSVVVDTQRPMRQASLFEMAPFYTDGTHHNSVGGEICGRIVADTLYWSVNDLASLGMYPVVGNTTNLLLIVDATPLSPLGKVSIGNRNSGMTSMYTYNGGTLDTTFNPASSSGYKFNDSANSINAFTISDAGLTRSAGGVGVGSGSVKITSGSGTPEGAVVGVLGDLFLRTDGAASTTLYVKTSNSGGNTGWTAK